MLRTSQNLPLLSPSERFITSDRNLTCFFQSRVRLFFLCSSPGLTNLELLVVCPEGWSACPWSMMAGDMRDRDSKPLTSDKVKFLFSGYWLLHCHGFEHLWSVSRRDVCMAEGSCKHSSSFPGSWMELGIGAQIWMSRDLEGDMGTNLIWMGDSRDVQCLHLYG